MIEPIYRDDLFIVKENGGFYISSIPTFPPCLRRVHLSNGEVYHSSMEEFELYRDKFKAILKSLEGETEEFFHVVCLNFNVIEKTCCELDIRFNKTPDELANLLLLSYRVKKEDAIKQIDYFVGNNNDLNWREEEKRDELINRYNLVDQYKEHMTSGFTKLMDSMSHGLDELKKHLESNNKNT